ncbi:MAG: glutathione peroxidase [Deltaproteobacteria bacterium]|nr:glutathione peroxidase [Deltaproteobacteria bacterium]
MLEDRSGQRIPKVTLPVREDGEWKELDTEKFFAGKTVVVFSLPGAFTPTCSSAHVPRYDELASAFEGHGVDEIVCVAVNDTFVMDAWQEDQEADTIHFLADGNGTFTEAMGMLVDKAAIGFGKRSWRYSMLVKDGTIEKMFIEPQKDGDPYEVSDADTMLRHIAPDAKLPADIFMLSKDGCAHCARARDLLDVREMDYDELEATPRTLRAVPGGGTTPQIFIDGQHIGGADELEAHLK